MNYDSWKLMTPEENHRHVHGLVYVTDCEYCSSELHAGEEVVKDVDEGLFFCDEECYEQHHREHMDYVELQRGDK